MKTCDLTLQKKKKNCIQMLKLGQQMAQMLLCLSNLIIFYEMEISIMLDH